MAPIVQVLLVSACILLVQLEVKASVHKREDRHRVLEEDSKSHDHSRVESKDGEKRGIIGNLLGLGNNNNANLPNRPNYIQPPNLVPPAAPMAPTVNIPSINNQQSYPTYNRPSLLGGLLSGGLLSGDKEIPQQQQLNMDWVKYALQKCAKFDTRKLTTILPSYSNGLTEPHMYYFANSTSDVKTWEEAERFCTANGMELVTINDAAENAAIQEKIKQILANSPPGDATNQFWVGLQDISLDGTYNWIGDGSSTFTDWHTGMPGGLGCVAIQQLNTADNLHMTDYDCTALDTFRYICEVSDECMGLMMSLFQQHKHKPHLHYDDDMMGYGSNYKN